MRSLFFLILSLVTFGYLAPIHKAIAQLNPDTSLGAESSVVNPDVINGISSDRIDRGAIRNSNLFHSFQDFNVDAGRGVYFSNPAGIANILTRVTGGNRSSIQGVLGVLGNANLFLINPRGISFGPNASLDLRGGSFFGTTADSVLFDNFEFSASNPQPVPQLTINIPIGLRFRDNPQPIANNSFAEDVNGNIIGLQVAPEKTLALVGGDVNFNTGFVVAPGGRVELGGLSQAGTVGLNPDGSLSFPNGVTKADVSVGNLSTVNVAGEGGGNIAVNARNLNIFGGGDIVAGIESGLGTPSAQAGDIVVNASGTVRIEGDSNTSRIRNIVSPSAQGNAGNITINANSLEGTGNFVIGSSTFGRGNAGKVTITADKVSLQGLENTASGIGSLVSPSAIGNANDIVIDTRSLSLSDSALLATSTAGQGNAGNIRIKASESVTFTNGASMQAATFSSGNAGKFIIDAPNANVSFDNSTVTTSTSGTGQGGDIDITARSLSLSNSTGLATSTLGQGNAGNIGIKASDSVFVSGDSIIQAASFASGNAGKIIIDSPNANVSFNNSTVSTSTFRTGQGGDIDINARSLSLDNSSQLFTNTSGSSNAGNINLNISESLNVRGTSRLRSQTLGDGKAGNIQVKTGSLLLAQKSELDSSTSGQGNAGNITITAKNGDIQLTDGSLILSNVESRGNGNAGEISVTAQNLTLKDGSQLQSLIRGNGKAGNISIEVSNDILFDGFTEIDAGGNRGFFTSGVYSNVESGAIGDGGQINISARNLTLTNNAQVQTLVRGEDLTSGLSAGQGNAGNIQVNVLNKVTLESGAQLRSDTFGLGNAGKVTIDGRDGVLPVVLFDGFGSNNASSGIFSIVGGVVPESTGNRQGGDISINASSLSLTNFALINNSTSGKGNAGGISIQVDGPIKLTNSSQIRSNVEAGGEGLGGNIKIDAKSLTLNSGAEIGAVVFRAENGLPPGKGKSGNIVINAKDFIDISGIGSTQFSSGIFTSAERGTTATQPQAAGDITITTGNFRIADGAVVDASTSNDGSGGSITINARNFTATGGGQVLTTSRGNGAAGNITLKVADNLTISGSDPNFNQRFEQARNFGEPTDVVTNQGAQSGIFANTAEGSRGKGGSIFIDPKQVTIKDGGIISATSSGTGEGGNIDLKAGNLTLDRGKITAESRSATGGNITLDIKDVLLLRRNSEISATAGRNQGAGNGGNININTGLLVALPQENSDIRADAFRGNGGNINIQADAVFGIQPRDFSTPLSDITASSESGVSGNVNLNTLDIDPTQGLSELPENTTDPSSQIAQNPCQKGSGSAFVITGRGGIPSGPNDGFNSDNVRVDLLEPITSSNNPQNVTNNLPKIQTATKEIIPAQGWIFNEKGEVVLTAYDPTTSVPQRSSKASASCPAPF
ncbi:filamentous hemagglutinin N-terminal domain-containing protein [Mastigocladus laminosus UU774]|nr:filamentous hemagglutinin N-terminal domain-containing protein [Mastigocladus laminosus UU774]